MCTSCPTLAVRHLVDPHNAGVYASYGNDLNIRLGAFHHSYLCALLNDLTDEGLTNSTVGAPASGRSPYLLRPLPKLRVANMPDQFL